MSQENVELVRRAALELVRTRRPRISEDWDPEFVWVSIEGWPGATELRGREEFMAFWEEWVAPYEQLDFSIERVLDAGGDEVLLLGCQRGRLRGSDSWVEFRYGLIYTFERGKITRVQAYSTQDEALEAAGLSK